MKRPRHKAPNPQTRKVACTVSAAALMLGVSHAATVGFNFQANYCAAPSYTGAIITGPAFGIGTNSWESLTPMDTGYGCSPGYYTLSQTIDTTTSTGGLNPLPHGSLSVTWSAYTANVSGFAGYSRPGPHYTYGGNGYNPGNEQVYWGFLRDGVNFGPGSSGGDNNQPGYSIDITGLKTLFTNSPFAVQLIASADSMQYLTNAFVIDATGSSTQSVYYPSTPPVSDVGDTAWVRGVGGGLSTASGAFDTDHLKIIGNRAAHVGPKTGYNFASTIAGFIITDKPVISMAPQPVVVCGGDTVTWSGYAVGVPPLSYQWRKNGKPITGATTAAFSITNVSSGDIANYDMVVTNLYGGATSGVVTVDTISTTPGRNFVVDSNPQGPEHDGLAYGATWVASDNDGAGTTRTGVMSFNAAHPDQVVVPGATSFDTTNGTVMFWMRSSGLANPAGKPGTLFDRLINGKGCVLVQNADGTLAFSDNGGKDPFATTGTVSDNKWHHVALTFSQAAGSGQIAIYIDGTQNALTFSVNGWQWPTGQELEFGLSHDTASWQAFNGLMDDVRVYNRILTDTEVASAFTGALVDTTALTLRLNFDTAPVPGVTLRWNAPDAILQGADVITGPYSDISGASSPYSISAQKANKFFRYHGHSPTNVVSNPYLM